MEVNLQHIYKQLQGWVQDNPKPIHILAELIVAFPLRRSVRTGSWLPMSFTMCMTKVPNRCYVGSIRIDTSTEREAKFTNKIKIKILRNLSWILTWLEANYHLLS